MRSHVIQRYDQLHYDYLINESPLFAYSLSPPLSLETCHTERCASLQMYRTDLLLPRKIRISCIANSTISAITNHDDLRNVAYSFYFSSSAR